MPRDTYKVFGAISLDHKCNCEYCTRLNGDNKSVVKEVVATSEEAAIQEVEAWINREYEVDDVVWVSGPQVANLTAPTREREALEAWNKGLPIKA